MTHTKKWLAAHAAISAATTPAKTTNGYTDEQWASAETQFKSHLYSGDESDLNDEPIGPDGTTPNSVVAAVHDKSVDGAKYIGVFADAGLLQL